MPAGYAIFNIEIVNPDAYKEYVNKVRPIAEQFGGEYLVRGGNNQVVEGDCQYSINEDTKDPTYEKALEWYNSKEYQPIKQIRIDNAKSNGIIIQGE